MSTILVVLILAMLAVASAFLIRRSIPRLSPDGQVLAQLKKAGSNFSKPHPMEFFLYFPSPEAAERAGAVLRKDGFDVAVQPAATGQNWLCHATQSMLPAEDQLLTIRQRLEALANQEGGVYDGWGTPVVE